jgi:hypothetical protein
VALVVLPALLLANGVLSLAPTHAQSQTAAPTAGSVAPADSATAPDPLAELNKVFREAYARTRQEILDRENPVILVEGDDLVLLRQGRRTVVRVIPERYHTLKTVSHVPLAIYVLLANAGEGELNTQRRAALRGYRDQLRPIGAALAKRGLSADQLRRQDAILSASTRFLDELLDGSEIKAGAVTAFARRMAPLVLANARDAARAQLEGLHRQACLWKAEMSGDEWRRLRVVIMGSPLPRRDNLAVKYFAHLLGEKGEGARIIFAESLFEERRALNLLGTYLLDTEIGAVFFDDPKRMNRDLLGEAAAECLREPVFEP